MIKKSNFVLVNFSYLLFVMFSSLIFYGVKFSFFPLDLFRLSYVISFIILLFFLNKIKYSSEWLLLCFFTLLSLFISVFVSLYTKSSELVFIRMIFDYLLTFLVLTPVYYFFLKKMNIDIVSFVIHMVFFQSLIMFLMVAFPSFQKIVLGIIDISGIERTDGVFRFRGVGLTGLATYSMAVTQALALFLFQFIWKNKLSNSSLAFSFIMFFSILLSSILSARTSFLFILILFLSFVCIYSTSSNRLLKGRLLNVLIFIFIAFSILIVLLSSIDSPVIVKMLSWSSELFVSFFETGSVSTESSEAMKDLFFMPDEFTFLIGDGQYLSSLGEYYMSTDIGYLRVLLYGGLAGSLSFYFSFFILIYILLSSICKVYNFSFALPLFFYFICVLIVNIKGSIFFDGFIAFKFISLLSFYFSREKINYFYNKSLGDACEKSC
ncbi:hypothetical protein L5L78_05010 [Shewanella sp. SM34]|uniref:hypothetical protein n=1 Tax=unclassified Shewanella TaxID=196818 RepID=UPI0021DB1350|nr:MULTISPECIES: hypothetical protein [unclassified Shewanella]MCU8055570.1 hypothetical protein [Shewanella sp. SM35]MCU8064492.1 hypothetical protein [Shewanella sp. SM34]